MNLSDLVHRSTHGHPDHPIEPFYIPSTPSSSSSPNGVYPAPPPPPDMYDAYPHVRQTMERTFFSLLIVAHLIVRRMECTT